MQDASYVLGFFKVHLDQQNYIKNVYCTNIITMIWSDDCYGQCSAVIIIVAIAITILLCCV